MKRTNQCPKCGSKDVVADAKAVDRVYFGVEQELSVATFRKPDAVFFKGRADSSLSAWICAACGFVEFYVDEPKGLRTADPDAPPQDRGTTP